MDTKSLAQPAPTTTTPQPLRLSGRLQRGLALAEERFEEITRIAPYVWEVPSCSGGHRYVVDLKHGLCTCPDHPPAGERCKHLSAAAYKKARTATCSGCRNRFRHKELVELNEDNHDDLTRFHGDLLCEGCAGDSGVTF